jgi:RTA1 like protein
MGAAWETIGFALHAVGAHNQQNIGYATAHNILFLLAPLWVNAFVYTTFSRVVYFFLPEQSVRGIKAAALAKYFVWADIVSFIIQGVGGIMASPGASPDIIKTGINVYMGGIGLQQSFILFFVFLMISFHRRAVQIEKSGTSMRQRDWRQLQYTLYGVLTAITASLVPSGVHV